MAQRVTTSTNTEQAAKNIAASYKHRNSKIEFKDGRWIVSWDAISINQIKKI